MTAHTHQKGAALDDALRLTPADPAGRTHAVCRVSGGSVAQPDSALGYEHVTTIPAAWGGVGAVDSEGPGWPGGPEARMSPPKASADRVQPDNRPGLGVAL